MKPNGKQTAFAALLAGVALLTITSAQELPTTGSIVSRLGKLELENGYPTEATVKQLYDDIDFQRACQAYLWALPMMGMVQWQDEQRQKFGAGPLDFVDYLTFTPTSSACSPPMPRRLISWPFPT